MLIRSVRGRMFSVSVMVLVTEAVFGQNFANKPIRLVTSEPGGGNDVVARLIAAPLTSTLRQQIVIDNRGSASGIIAAQTVAKASPDGNTLLFYGSGLWLLPYLKDSVPFDPVKDFTAITLAGSSPNIIVVHPSLQVKSVKELIALAKTRQGELNYGSGSTGSTPHLAAELFNAMANVNIMNVPYKGGGAAVNALIGGEVQVMFPTVSLGIPYVNSGRLKALAVTSARPSALAPGLPTVAAAGLRDFESVLLVGVYAPAGTPSTLINRLNQALVRVINSEDIKERFLAAGLEPVGSTPQHLADLIKTEMTKWGKVIKDAGIRSQ